MDTTPYNMMEISRPPKQRMRFVGRLIRRHFPDLYMVHHMKLVRKALIASGPYMKNIMETVLRENRLFDLVEIETINRCNGTCTFCSANKDYPVQRPFKKMDESLFKKIIGELHDLEYNGALRMHSNNEPLLDNRIYDWLRYAREQLPFANLYLYTNGTLLTPSRFERLMMSLDQLYIDSYAENEQVISPVQTILDMYAGYPAYKGRVTVLVTPWNEVRYNKANDAPNYSTTMGKKQIPSPEVGCVFPFRQFSIRPDGQVILCCNDVFAAQGTMGDTNKNTLKEIWYGEPFTTARNNLLKGRPFNPRCVYCDFIM